MKVKTVLAVSPKALVTVAVTVVGVPESTQGGAVQDTRLRVGSVTGVATVPEVAFQVKVSIDLLKFKKSR